MENSIRQQIGGYCPYCGAKIKNYVENKWLYGCPLRVCEKCGEKYIDRRYHEIALEGYQPGALSVKRDLKLLLICAALLLASGGMLYYELNFSSYYHPMLLFLVPMGILAVIFTLTDIIRIKTGAKEIALEKLKAESEERLGNTVYARQLQETGYNVPDRFIDGQM